MTAAQNKLLLEVLADGSMRFEKVGAYSSWSKKSARR